MDKKYGVYDALNEKPTEQDMIHRIETLTNMMLASGRNPKIKRFKVYFHGKSTSGTASPFSPPFTLGVAVWGSGISKDYRVL